MSTVDCNMATRPHPSSEMGKEGMFRWFCVQSLPGEETKAFQDIETFGYQAHLPTYVRRCTRYGKREEIRSPLFPSYLFVSFHPEDPDWAYIPSLKHVRRVFMANSGRPHPLKVGAIEDLMAMGRAGDGVIDDQAPAFPRIAPGASVRITGGPMTDWAGVCAWSTDERIGVLMTMFNAERVVPMPRASVEAV